MLALRVRGFKSIGAYPDFVYFGGNSEMRGYDYLQFVGQNVGFANAELRFPIIEAALTPIGVVGGVRGVFFANIGAGWFDHSGFQFATNNDSTYRPIIGYERDALGQPIVGDDGISLIPDLRTAQTVSGFRLVDGRASYGIGPRNLRARLPDPLRLGVAHALQQGLGRPAVLDSRRQQRIPQGPLRGVDWVRLLDVWKSRNYGSEEVGRTSRFHSSIPNS